jgi:hypothetical protein
MCGCTELTCPQHGARNRRRRHPDSPGYWSTAEGRWVSTGCSLHDLDPCPRCDGEVTD